MPERAPVVAGRFYPAAPDELQTEARSWLTAGKTYAATAPLDTGRSPSASLRGFMLPHAGYAYCGKVLGAALASPWEGTTAGACLPERLVILCPNHTGRGAPLGVWPEGAWRTPLGNVPVDAAMAAALCGAGGFEPDLQSHLDEHSIEVLLPFLQCLPPPHGKTGALRSITPVCVGTMQHDALLQAGLALAEALRQCGQQGAGVGVIVSSDMNHFEDQESTMHKDSLALSQALACDPEGLLAVVQRNRITMCGAAPMALALFAAHALGDPWAELCMYDTSATASGDTRRVVGYAGLRFGLN
ncbi:AmmeMemoRadiSam system protein B [Desulfovibrio desulfuricans]|uniref:MEMO1 family protein DDIC_10560 n=1 Tax=Desulfovibrio desulfuricans TaxID=876 RepID=A0A4P7UIR9_DESDE|nr:AmmeMemoRadiSam system protein B [Desulfovibrio desulfuricans]QCC86306.1 AmmeMemoRadiSam system protein B [Desulfovibrio desulfuricans]